VRNFHSGKPCGATPAIKDQMPAVIASLWALHASKVRVIGVADITPLSPFAREFVGNNAGLARMRASCIARWLVTSNDFVGVEIIKEVELPRELQWADSTDRAVAVFALTQLPEPPRRP
jgi:hypothetical protein